ncbi:sensor histidine kinase [Sungkyunkwania multivorans]|uniref:histidine kinase n=1 Tax=Sungkyunkwania multivorans TaxID=1173618 RepID=A0ABW3CTD9_9FLAO
MNFKDQNNNTRLVLIISSFVIVLMIVWNTYSLFQTIKKEERTKMELWSIALIELVQSEDLEKDYGNLVLEVLSSNTSTPIILVDENGTITDHRNIDPKKIVEGDTTYLQKVLKRIRKENAPIQVKYKNIINGKLYYGDTWLLRTLKYFPIALVLIIFLFAAVAYFFYSTSKISEQNKLWAGMAKETAHQIGTPLSSLLGWLEILRADNVSEDTLTEIKKDIDRLQTITERFSKVGSVPELEKIDIVEETKKSYDYLKARSSKLVSFEVELPEGPIYVMGNQKLYSWTIENLVKNAIDAMKGKGTLRIELNQLEDTVSLYISDTGKGIHKSLHKKIFEPGFTSKKRGWGLGLSLAKRIIEDYHNGKIKVNHSELDKGTTMKVTLKSV